MSDSARKNRRPCVLNCLRTFSEEAGATTAEFAFGAIIAALAIILAIVGINVSARATSDQGAVATLVNNVEPPLLARGRTLAGADRIRRR